MIYCKVKNVNPVLFYLKVRNYAIRNCHENCVLLTEFIPKMITDYVILYAAISILTGWKGWYSVYPPPQDFP